MGRLAWCTIGMCLMVLASPAGAKDHESRPSSLTRAEVWIMPPALSITSQRVPLTARAPTERRSPPAAGAARGAADATRRDWVTLLDEGFESSFPGANGWELFSGSGNYTWSDDDFKPRSGGFSVWCAGLADAGSPDLDPEFDDYVDDMAASMIWGPFDLSDATEAEVEFWFWLDSEENYDFLVWAASTDRLTGYSGFQLSGQSAGWEMRTFDLSDVPSQGSLLGEPQVWFRFFFSSDYSNTAQGAFIDDVVIRKFVESANTPPSIVHTPVSNAAAASPLAVSATMTDNESTPTGTLYYRRGGDLSFAATSMMANGDTYTGTIPANRVTSWGVEYYLIASDGELVRTDPVQGAVAPHVVGVRTGNLTSTVPQPAGTDQNAFRMISVPGAPEAPQVTSLLFDDFGTYDNTEWRLFRYEGGAFHEYPAAEVGTIETGKAYWLITRMSGRVIDSGATGSVSTAQDFTIMLEPGWNDIGLPFAFPVDWADVQVSPTGVDGPYLYEGAWLPPSQVMQLEPWKGYALFNNGSAAEPLSIPPRAALGAVGWPSDQASPVLDAATWSLRLGARCAAARDPFNDLGWAPDASATRDHRDSIEPRPIGAHVALAFRHDDWMELPGLYTSDFRPPRPPQTPARELGDVWKLEVTTNIREAPVELGWAGLESLPPGFRAVLFDPQSSVRVDLAATPGYSMYADPRRDLELWIGSAEFVEAGEGGGAAPLRFVDLGAAPNPFAAAGGTVLRFQLPAASPVGLRLYDGSGRLVRERRDPNAPAGEYRFHWDGRGDRGQPQPNGVYFYRLEAGELSAIGKISLVR